MNPTASSPPGSDTLSNSPVWMAECFTTDMRQMDSNYGTSGWYSACEPEERECQHRNQAYEKYLADHIPPSQRVRREKSVVSISSGSAGSDGAEVSAKIETDAYGVSSVMIPLIPEPCLTGSTDAIFPLSALSHTFEHWPRQSHQFTSSKRAQKFTGKRDPHLAVQSTKKTGVVRKSVPRRRLPGKTTGHATSRRHRFISPSYVPKVTYFPRPDSAGNLRYSGTAQDTYRLQLQDLVGVASEKREDFKGGLSTTQAMNAACSEIKALWKKIDNEREVFKSRLDKWRAKGKQQDFLKEENRLLRRIVQRMGTVLAMK